MAKIQMPGRGQDGSSASVSSQQTSIIFLTVSTLGKGNKCSGIKLPSKKGERLSWYNGVDYKLYLTKRWERLFATWSVRKATFT